VPPEAAAPAEPEAAVPEAPPPEAPAAPPADADVVPGPPPGAPHIAINFLAYSRIPARRTVTLTIDGTDMITMSEGERLGTIEIVRILPNRVHLRYGDGPLFAVRSEY
jgi:hypothetical protein